MKFPIDIGGGHIDMDSYRFKFLIVPASNCLVLKIMLSLSVEQIKELLTSQRWRDLAKKKLCAHRKYEFLGVFPG
jgi:hypothetical protein